VNDEYLKERLTFVTHWGKGEGNGKITLKVDKGDGKYKKGGRERCVGRGLYRKKRDKAMCY